MKYVSNLIPEKSRVLEYYFKGNIYETKKIKVFQKFLRWLLASFFILFALLSLKHPLITLLFGFIGFMISPFGHVWLEKKFKFRLTKKIKSFSAIIILLFSFPLLVHYNTIDNKKAEMLSLKFEKEKRERIELERKEKIRNDSLTYYLNISSQFALKHKTDDAFKQLKAASLFSKLPEDIERISIEKRKISTIRAYDLVKAEKYKLALSDLNTLISETDNNSNLYYNRALCFSKTGKIGEAVSDCLKAMKLGDIRADKLYNKINPVKRRIAYYVTRCCDGTTSSSSGRGTCSHHGGVCNWSEPVYEEYRKYE
ncbi:hypothetical protein [Flavobacterium hungaricum]|uniref:DUF3761 domain-containing protein n=1 Tax=Flavobacterium hungaricum TaxID=2082725 RepID=A0ABR9TLF0_9FLAO|nr:hypothetical protein [Flavobacterium hungaricum]MBE8726195.1 hypothetical protein [Flavobacterium hungaricum]